MLGLIFVSLLVLGSTHSDTELGDCPDVTAFQDFEVEPYIGRWYEERRTDLYWEGHQYCNMAIYSDLGDGVIEVHNTGVTEDGYFTDIYGKADVYAPGILNLTFPGHTSGFYYVLGTDYETYSSVYSCEQYGAFRALNMWVLAREVPLSNETLEEAFSHYTANGIDTSIMSQTYQGDDCIYYAPSGGGLY